MERKSNVLPLLLCLAVVGLAVQSYLFWSYAQDRDQDVERANAALNVIYYVGVKDGYHMGGREAMRKKCATLY